MKIRSEINEIENKCTLEKTNKAKNWIFVKNNKIDRSLARHVKTKRGKTQITYIMYKIHHRLLRH